ncbi:pyridoxamine 5'-phosphate oxidase family protein [Streptomyces sp. 049-1]|uniref:pyridoxamine 5'-phosphate oxidase family protein n=1 Tax=Streptomyces sp. 049-1 TaxID=2789264 RepID=UPI00398080F1
MHSLGFHEGEQEVQRRAGVTDEAARLEGMLLPPNLEGGLTLFLAKRTLAALTARDQAGRLWTSLLCGEPGFLEAHGSSLIVHTAPGAEDPFRETPPGQTVGLLTIDFAIRRRVRVNGLLTRSDPGILRLEADQAFGNCPAYIQQRTLTSDTTAVTGRVGEHQAPGHVLTPEDEQVIRQADTFFLGTTHPTRGTDTSHKGGNPGFVRIEDGTIWWPDYAGNNLFNSLGNISANSAAALLFIDFSSGRLIQLSGTAEIEWVKPGSPGDDGGTGRRVRFHPQQARTSWTSLGAESVALSPHNPQVDV